MSRSQISDARSQMDTRKFLITKPGKYEYEVVMSDLNSNKELLGVIVAEIEGDYVVNLLSEHKVGKTNCRVDVKGVVRGGARVKVKGLVKIAEGASQSDSFLSMKLLLLDDKSSAVAEPELEIENNEVKASHSASVGRIDEEQLYYLETRGINKLEAENLIIKGFLEVK
jgi:Fe-S cluster assembly scaffold protein SufB